jgi:hypothetical protein
MKSKKTVQLRTKILLALLFVSTLANAQRWRLGGNTNLPAADDITVPGANQLGSQFGFNVPINIITNGSQKAQFTVSTGIPAGLFGAAGDGLRIYPNTPGSFPNGYLDLWTSTSAAAANETHIKWDGSGQIGGSGAWFRMWSSAGNGLEFNTTIATSRYIYRRLGNEVGRIGINNYWKIGQALFGDANRRLEVAENIPNNPQFRISYSAGLILPQLQ